MSGYATLRLVSAERFGTEVRRRRQLRRMSRPALAAASGLSESGISLIEVGRAGEYSAPKRTTVIDLAVALDWDPDEALAMAGYEPLVDDERAQLVKPAIDLRRELDALWPQLTEPQQHAILVAAATMVNPQTDVSVASDGAGKNTVAYWLQRSTMSERCR